MAKQNLTIKDIANLILSFNEMYYFAQDSDDGESFCIMDYVSRDEFYCTGNKLKMTISKDKIEIFYFPSLNIVVPIENENEFQELVSLYLDFKNKVEKFLLGNLKNLITNKINHKNPYNGNDVFMEIIRDLHDGIDRMHDQQRRAHRRGAEGVAPEPVPEPMIENHENFIFDPEGPGWHV